MTISQSFDQLRLGLQAARDVSRNVAGNFAVIENVGTRATGGQTAGRDMFEPTMSDGEKMGEHFHASSQSRGQMSGALSSALSTLDEMGLPVEQALPLRNAIEQAMTEDAAGTFERMQIKAVFQSATEKLEQTRQTLANGSADDVRIERATQAADSSGNRQVRIERHVDTALDVLTDLELRYDSEEEIPSRQEPVPQSPAANQRSAWEEFVGRLDPAQQEGLGLPPDTTTFSYPAAPEIPQAPAVPQWAASANHGPLWVPTGSWPSGNGLWSSTSTIPLSTTSSVSHISFDNVNALTEAVWGKKDQAGDTPSAGTLPSLSSSSVNTVNDFLMERGEFAPKEEDE